MQCSYFLMYFLLLIVLQEPPIFSPFPPLPLSPHLQVFTTLLLCAVFLEEKKRKRTDTIVPCLIKQAVVHVSSQFNEFKILNFFLFKTSWGPGYEQEYHLFAIKSFESCKDKPQLTKASTSLAYSTGYCSPSLAVLSLCLWQPGQGLGTDWRSRSLHGFRTLPVHCSCGSQTSLPC